MSGSYKAQVWVDGSGVEFPEQSAPYSVQNNTGICLSGGGTRALSAGLGQLRGLNELGLIPSIDYISCVSGGSWLASVYTYYRGGASNDAEFLGPQTGPSHITDAWLNQMSKNCMGHTATKSLSGSILAYKLTMPDRLVWISAVGQTYLSDFGLFDLFTPTAATYYSLDDARVGDIKKRNAQLKNATFFTVRAPTNGDPKRPYLVMNSCIATPESIVPPPAGPETLVGFEYTPLYVGVPITKQTFQFPNSKGPAMPAVLGGGVSEPFAFGGTGATIDPTGPPTAAFVNVPDFGPGMPHRLVEATGTSSSAYVAESSELGVTAFSPLSAYWPPPTGGSQTTRMDFGDGGSLENYGLIALLRRKVKRVVVFINTETKLQRFDPTKNPTASDIDESLPPLFGFSGVNPNMGGNQVFAQADFVGVANGLIMAKFGSLGVDYGSPSGGGASFLNGTILHKSTHKVLPNKRWGLAGGHSVDVLWVYNDRVLSWEKDLPQDIRHHIEKGNELHPQGPFKHFPNYKTVDQNGFPKLVELTAAQVNLLAALSCWNVTENEKTFKAFL